MRLLFLFTGMLFFVNTYGQEVELQGRYTANFGATESFEFVGKDSFYFYGAYNFDVYRGKGRCEIRNNYLYLYFENDPGNRPAVIAPSNNNDSFSLIQLTLVDNYNKPIPNAAVETVRDKEITLKAYTSSDGLALLKIRNDAFPIVIRTSAVDFNVGTLRLDRSSNYYIRLYHSAKESELNKGQKWVYEIEELSEDLILMRQKNGGEFREYRKQ
jgi:hypothetical protein